VSGRTPNQTAFIRTILDKDITLAHGPAGTGKTHIAVGMAVYALKSRSIERIILCRPAVDSGASIGYLPGTMEEKIGPYLAPLFDELSYYVEPSAIRAWMEHKIIEIVPLPFMRGRTFNNAYVVLDEAQNATMPEIRMFLTRIGLNSRMILVGDLHQTDLPRDQRGAFGDCIHALDGMEGVGVCELLAEDIIRHRLIGEIEKRLSPR
jgi:phosphate starvation-inducible PhoH-like protein